MALWSGIAVCTLANSWSDGFDSGRLDPDRWIVISEGDFRERVVDVVEVRGKGSGDFRLRLRADTIGTDDETVKFLGVRSRHKILIGERSSLALDLDWNNQINGSYLSAAVVLCPSTTSGNPLKTDNWLKVEYVGVPPGRNARMVVACKTAGREKFLHTEGWPDINRPGRKIGLQKLEIRLGGNLLEIRENGKAIFSSDQSPVSFSEAHLFLLMSSHSNYSAREVYFDNVRIADDE